MNRLAIEGGPPTRSQPFPAWPPPPSATLRDAILAVLDAGSWWQSGEGQAEELESWLRSELAGKAVVAVSNGTVALELALRALDIGRGDEVLVPAITFMSTAAAVSVNGAVPVPVDVDPGTLCIDPEDLARAVSPRTRAVVPVHLAGQPADMDGVLSVSREAGLAVVEDSAQAITARWRGGRVGTFGDLATFSFQASKLLPGGDGGAIALHHRGDLAEVVTRLANCGRPRGSLAPDHTVIGTNGRIGEFQAALVVAQADGIEAMWERRQAAAAQLTARLDGEGTALTPTLGAGVTRTDWYWYVLRLPADLTAHVPASQFAEMLSLEGIPASPLLPPFYRLAAYADLPPRSCAAAEAVHPGTVVLHHRLLLAGDEGVQDIVAAIRKIVHTLRSGA